MKARARIGARIKAIHACPTFAEGIELTADDWLKTRAQTEAVGRHPATVMIKERRIIDPVIVNKLVVEMIDARG